MTGAAMNFRGSEGQTLPLFPIDKTREALSQYCAERWPVGRRKMVEKTWDLTPDEARRVCEGRASQCTLDKVWLHKKNGRWKVIFPVFAILFDEPADKFIEKEKSRHADHAQRLGALVRDLRPGRSVRPDPANSPAREPHSWRNSAGD